MSKTWNRKDQLKPIRDIEFPNRRLKAEICSEINRDSFDASFKLSAFDGESTLKITLDNNLNNITEKDNVITLNDIHKVYHRNNDTEFEWEIEFKTKPENNRFLYRIDMENFDARYQPETIMLKHRNKGLIDCEDKILGSYAIYHNTKKHNEYKTGKAFHIYRPEAIDANGNKVWCDITIDEDTNTLALTIPQHFLDQARYPVIIDPTIGYETDGGTGLAIGDEVNYYKITMTENGTLTHIHSKTASYESPTVYSGIYSDSGGNPNTLLEEEDTGYVPADWSDGAWHQIDMAGTLSLSSGSSYWIAIVNDSTTNGGIRLRGDYNEYHYTRHAGESGTVFPSTASATYDSGDYDYDVNLYITYTADDGGGTTYYVTCDETITISDTDIHGFTKIIGQDITLNDNILKYMATSKGENISINDIKQLIIDKNLASEAISLSTLVSKEIFKQLYEYIIITDLSTKIYNKLVEDNVTITDSLLTETSGLVLRIVTELISVADSTKKDLDKITDESVLVIDSIIAQRLGALIERIVSEAISISDQVTTESFIEKILTELITITDSLEPHSINKVINQTINVDDFIKKYLHRQIKDDISITDTVSASIVGIVLATLIRLQSVNVIAGSELKDITISYNGKLKNIHIIGG